ncbi:patatin-like phospholipase family protein [Methylobacterium haplocladii]|uniref:Phospholipase n=1 Tax=Methylobacterium haplocladii TaxID=1176176 RepID=A0A512IUL8_9HYPH|nr:patatin-like phospholipase family protein [Methylobacterium haplocladii]GEP01329.1 phospholipase [Methylobacterium haplocladii]GJD83873.1 putative NTE family protein [Methylobacterium haplocladii]GLS59968.1 phospholipase [Methylobacterium haplocladii]
MSPRAALHVRSFPEGIVEPVEAPRPRTPRVGLALGGGSARGWAHIGVIEALQEAGIVPEIVAGCSIGAVVGGAYAAGKLDRLKAFALSLTKRRVMGLVDLRIAGSGLIAGERLARRLSQELENRRIEALPVAFACVATELGTGHEVWLTNGPLVESVRASYAIPGLFPPVLLDSRLLMDGTLVNPVPVRLARELGADVVICVNLACDPRVRGSLIRPEPPPEEDELEDELARAVETRSRWAMLCGAGLRMVGRSRRTASTTKPGNPGVARVIFDAFNITQDRISRARLATDPPDVMVTPRLAAMGLFEFHRAAEGIALGREAARAALPEIRRMIEGAAARV